MLKLRLKLLNLYTVLKLFVKFEIRFKELYCGNYNYYLFD